MERVKAFLKRQSSPTKDTVDSSKVYGVYYSNKRSTMPPTPLKKWSSDVLSACTGPNAGITQLDLHSVTMDSDQNIAGIRGWNQTTERYSGLSASLYEEMTTDTGTKLVGDPIADVYASVARGNNNIAAIADGCSWGKKPRLAARCAVRAAVEHIVKSTSDFNKRPSSETLLKIIDEAIDASQKSILQNKATTTTLSIAISCEMANGNWCLFTASLGDSRVFIYSVTQQLLLEVTVGSHPSDGKRATRSCGGALGPVIGTRPDLENLSYSFTPIAKGDLVVLMTDGISDNFIHKPSSSTSENTRRRSEDGFALLSTRDAVIPSLHTTDTSTHELQPCCQISHELHRSLQNHCHCLGNRVSATTISSYLLNTAMEISEEKREFRNKCSREGINIYDEERKNPEFAKIKEQLVGKLDHATVLSITV